MKDEDGVLKKLSKKTRSALINALIIITTIALVFYLGATNGDIGDAWRALRSAETVWVAAAVLSWIVFVMFESLGVHVFFVQQKVKIKFRSSLLVSLIGIFYSNVTPAATGGQPMQVFAFKKRGVPTGVSTSALTVKFFCFETALLLLGGLLWMLYPGIVGECIASCKVIVITGFVINGFVVALVLLLAINRNIVRAILHCIIGLLVRIRLIRNRAKAEKRTREVLHEFHASVDMVTHHPLQLLVLLLVSCVQILGLMSISYFVYRAMGQSAHSYGEILVLQFLLYIGASFTPLPGASGAQEGGFYLFFQAIFPENKLLGALLLWRFFTYYLSLLVGFGGVIFNSAADIHRTGKISFPTPERLEEEEMIAQEDSGTASFAGSPESADGQEAERKDS